MVRLIIVLKLREVFMAVLEACPKYRNTYPCEVFFNSLRIPKKSYSEDDYRSGSGNVSHQQQSF